jgi:crotonobetainyl-CoA:carnitine CoA-transferase CaiB-like acyl-CoA transferase
VLSPYRVLDLTDERGHLAGYMLAALGADVIKIEPPDGSPVRRKGPFLGDESLTFAAYDRGKRSVVADIDTAEGAEIVRRLAAGADVMLESDAPGAMARRGLGPDDLAAINPALVYTSITPFGQDGPKAQWLATDLTMMASGCSMAQQGDSDRAPVRVSVPQAFHFGAAAAAGASILALLERGRDGRGQHVDVAAQQVIPIATQAGVLAAAVNSPIPTRVAGGVTFGDMNLKFVYPASDGYVSITHVFGESIGPNTARLMQWAHEEGFCSAEIAGMDWVMFPMKVEAGDYTLEQWEIAKAAVSALTSSKTKAELLAGAIERRLVVAPIVTSEEVLATEHWATRGFFHPVHLPSGESAAGPGHFAQTRPIQLRTLDRVAAVGEHTDEVLAMADRTPALDGGRLGDDGPGALSGIKILDLTWSLAGPFSGRVLADHGATVVKVESTKRPDPARGFMPLWNNEAGVENSALFDSANAGKMSLTLDLSKPEGREVLRDLVAWADVVSESFSANTLDKWGIGYEQMKEINPSIILMSTCLTGQYGPLSKFAGYGNLGAALSGFYGLAGWPDRAPSGPFGAYTDYTSTHFMSATIAAALDHRRRTGQGQFIDLAQAEAAMHFLSPAFMAAAGIGQVANRLGNADLYMAPHGAYPSAGNDRWIAIACETDDQWLRLCEVMERPDLAADESLATATGRLSAADPLNEAVAAFTTTRDDTDLMYVLQERGVTAHRVQNSAECLDDPQLLARGHFVEVEHSQRRSITEASRFRLTRTPGAPARSAPMLGEHNYEILHDLLGYDADRIAELAAAELLE